MESARQHRLHSAVMYGDLAALQAAIAQGANCNAKDVNGRTALLEACLFGYLEIVRYLVEHCNVDVNAKTKSGHDALLEASAFGNLETVQYLVEQCHADLRAQSTDGSTALNRAIDCSNLAIVEYLVPYYYARTSATSKALIMACRQNKHHIVRFLARYFCYDADGSIREYMGRTALHYACAKGELDVIQFLLYQCHADMNAKDNDGKSALHFACYSDQRDIVRLMMVECHSAVNATDVDNTTPLLYEWRHCIQKPFDVVPYLVETGKANVHVKDKDGKTVLHDACERGDYLQIVRYLVEKLNVDVHVQTINGRSALHFARKSKDLRLVLYLLEQWHF